MNEFDLLEQKLNIKPEERWENLTISNDFLFGKVMNDIGLYDELVRIVLPEFDFGGIQTLETQKTSQAFFDVRGSRFDLFAVTAKKQIIDTEIQTKNLKVEDLLRRIRVYHFYLGYEAANKKYLQKSGDYSSLPDCYVIFICTFDPFGEGRHIYTLRNVCEQNKNLDIDNGAYTIVLNTKGTKDDVSLKLKAFLDFVNGISSDDPYVKKLEIALKEAKHSALWRLERMFLEMKFADIEAKGRAEGREEGIEEGIFRVAKNLKQIGISISDIIKATGLTLQQVEAI